MDLNQKTVRDLRKIVAREGIALPARGHGKNGGVLKKDIIQAIRTHRSKQTKTLPSADRLKAALLYRPSKKSRGATRIRFFVDSFVYVPSKDNFEVRLYDGAIRRLIYATVKLDPNKTHVVSAVQSNPEKFGEALSNPKNKHFT